MPARRTKLLVTGGAGYVGAVATHRLDIREQAGIIVARPAVDGVHCAAIVAICMPLAVRRWCRLTAGDRALLAADPATGVLVAYPLAVLDRLLHDLHAAVAGGEAA